MGETLIPSPLDAKVRVDQDSSGGRFWLQG